MKTSSILFLNVIAIILLTSKAFAGVSGVSFSKQEIVDHAQKSTAIAHSAAQCLNDLWSAHETFFNTYGFSKFYGNRHYGKNYDKVAVRRQVLASYNPKIASSKIQQGAAQMITTACITMTVRCLEFAFAQNDQAATWKKINDWIGRADPVSGQANWYGHELQLALIDLGWTSMYWNPKPSENAAWDKEEIAIWKATAPEKKHDPKRGQHAYTYQTVMKKNLYYTLPIHDKKTLVDFDSKVPAEFKAVPFYVGIAHLGYHVFPGTYGKVIEAHSRRKLGAWDNIEFGEFNPILANNNGFGPKWTDVEKYRSGVIVVPPGFINR